MGRSRRRPRSLIRIRAAGAIEARRRLIAERPCSPPSGGGRLPPFAEARGRPCHGSERGEAASWKAAECAAAFPPYGLGRAARRGGFRPAPRLYPFQCGKAWPCDAGAGLATFLVSPLGEARRLSRRLGGQTRERGGRLRGKVMGFRTVMGFPPPSRGLKAHALNRSYAWLLVRDNPRIIP
jgi:hypothetical protein